MTEKHDRELKIKFLRLKQKNVQSVRNRISISYEEALEPKRRTLSESVNEVSRLRSRFNVVVKELSDRREREIELIRENEELLERKMRQLEYEEHYWENYAERNRGERSLEATLEESCS